MTIRIPTSLVILVAALVLLGGAAWWLLRERGDSQSLAEQSQTIDGSNASPPSETSGTFGSAQRDRGLGLKVGAKSSAPPGERWALLIGINNYSDPLPKLAYCARDMQVIRDVLVEYGGYKPDHVRLLVDTPPDENPSPPPPGTEAGKPLIVQHLPSHGNIFIALSTFLQQAKPEDTVLLAFSGHGECDEDKRHYLMPIDSSPDTLRDSGVAMTRVHEYLTKCQARQKVLILDCCHSGAGAKSDPKPATRFNPTTVPSGKGFVQLFSSGADQVSREDVALKQGVFSYYLAEGLRGKADVSEYANHDAIVTFDELYHYVYARVSEHSSKRQTPEKAEHVAGTIVLAVKPDDAGSPVASDDTLERLAALESQRELPVGFHQQAQRWLELSSSFRPAQQLKLPLRLLAARSITHEDFALHFDALVERVDSHDAIRSNLPQRARALIIGINRYAGEELRFAVADAEQFADTLRSHTATEISIDLLLDQAASTSAVLKKIEALKNSTKPGDLLIVYFAGRGLPADNFVPEHDGGAWWIPTAQAIDAPLHQPNAGTKNALEEPETPAHRGLSKVQVQPTFASRSKSVSQDDALAMTTLCASLQDCPGAVVILSDCCDAHFPAHHAVDPATAHSGPLTFIGVAGAALELTELGHGVLTYAIVNGLTGEADRHCPLWLRRGDAAVRNTAPASDGYVSLLELTTYLQQRSWLQSIVGLDDYGRISLQRMPLVVQNCRLGDDVVVTRSSNPID